MLLKGEMGTGKTGALVEKYVELLKEGVSPSKILVLAQNSHKRALFSASVREKLPLGAYPKLNIYTFFGLSYNFVLDFWALVEKDIKNPAALFEPNMCGLEVSQHIFKKCVERVEFQGYNSKVNLLHQLLRRYSLIVQNALSEDEVFERTKVLKESFTKEAAQAISLYRGKTLSLRAFDYLRQLSVFSHLYKNVENPFEYVLLDDGDEITPACFEYLKYIKPTVKKFFVAFDPLGSSRLGYLSAKITDFEGFLDEKAKKMGTENDGALKLFNGIKEKTPAALSNINFFSSIRRDEMIKEVTGKINSLLKNGVKPSDIVLVTPCIDLHLRYFLKNIKAELFYLSGSEKLVQNPLVAGVLTFLKVINLGLSSVSRQEYRSLCLKLLGLPLDVALDTPSEEHFLEFIEEAKTLPVAEQIYKICTTYINTQDRVSVMKLNQLMEQMRDFEAVFGTKEAIGYATGQLEHTIISENPLSGEEIPEDAIIVGTMQKVIDNEVRAKYHFWLDISSAQWLKQDVGPLYNAWVFQKDWNKPSFEVEDNIELTLDKAARVLRKLYLCAKERVFAYSSVYDFSGVENFGGVNKFFVADTHENKKAFKISPRPDQEPVLAYKGGKMAVSAVAGSGKTTIMLALILKLLEQKVLAENIFVLTFMESAARNFKERIKESFPHLTELPHISTIHGLALRILKENNNHALVGLDDDFEILDEARRTELLREIIFSLEMDPSDVELYDRGISTFKSQGDAKNVKSPLFKKIFSQYERLLKEANCIDYDDLLVLSLRLLRANPGVMRYYQNLAKFVIEDEAQDSSALQQELISILGAGSGNIIRCGDVNQAITSTFSNSDVEGFKSFIKENSNVKMDHSQRCAKKVYELANALLDSAFSKNIDAFLDTKMKPVKDKNPVFKNELLVKSFETQSEERLFVLAQVQKIFKDFPTATIGILLRSNWGVNDWAGFMTQNLVKTVTRTDVLINNPVFALTLAIFNFLLIPKDNVTVLELLKTLRGLGFYLEDEGLLEYIEKLSEPFIFSSGQDYKLWWDLNYFIRRSHLQAEELALEVGDFYFKNSSHRSNVIMTSLIVSKLTKAQGSFEGLVSRLNEVSRKPNHFGLKFFDTESTDPKEGLGGKVQIMTLHKSKGDEFDFVFVPELTSENLPLSPCDIKLKANSTFVENLKKHPKTPDELKEEAAKENYRLLYVAITRAKKSLTLSFAKKFRKSERKPCEFLEGVCE